MAITAIPKQPKKSVDLPPTGPGNDDPLTGETGAHPIETGIGTALAGAATGFIMGVAAGPIGAVAGAVLGGVAGGYAGRGVGEYIDPTDPALVVPDETEFDDVTPIPPPQAGTHNAFAPVYHNGPRSELNSVGKTFEEIEHESPSGFIVEPTQTPPPLPGERNRGI